MNFLRKLFWKSPPVEGPLGPSPDSAPRETEAPEAPTQPEWTRVFEAIRDDDLEELEALLSKDPSLVRAGQEHMGAPPLHWAVAKGSRGAAEILLSHGAEVNAEDAQGATPLAEAFGSGDRDLVNVLRRHGAKWTLSEDGLELPVPLAEFPLTEPPPGWREGLKAHLIEHLGEFGGTIMETMSMTVALDAAVFEAKEDRPCHTLVTMGMSDAKLNVTDGAECLCRQELMVYLPRDWPLDWVKVEPRRPEEPPDGPEGAWWIMGALKDIARYAHTHEAFLAPGQTLAFPEPPSPGSRFTSALVLHPLWEEDSFSPAEINGEPFSILWIVPITQAECDYKQEHGAEALLELLDANPDADIWLDLNRPCSVKPEKPSA